MSAILRESQGQPPVQPKPVPPPQQPQQPNPQGNSPYAVPQRSSPPAPQYPYPLGENPYPNAREQARLSAVNAVPRGATVTGVQEKQFVGPLKPGQVRPSRIEVS